MIDPGRLQKILAILRYEAQRKREAANRVLASAGSDIADIGGQFGSQAAQTAVRFPEGGLRLLGREDTADKLKGVRERIAKSVGPAKTKAGVVSGMAGTVAPFLAGSIGTGGGTLGSMLARGAALDVPAEASGRDFSVLGMVADWRKKKAEQEGRPLTPTEENIEKGAESPLARGLVGGGFGVTAGLLGELLPGARAARRAEDARIAERSKPPLPPILKEADQDAIDKILEARRTAEHAPKYGPERRAAPRPPSPDIEAARRASERLQGIKKYPGRPAFPSRAGAAHPAVVKALARTGIGAAGGAAATSEEGGLTPLEGAGIGALALNAPSLVRGGKKIVGGTKQVKVLPDFSQRIQSRIAGEAQATRKPIGELLEDIYSGVVSSTQRLRRPDKLAGAGLPIEKSVFAAGRATQGSARRAQGFMTYGPRRYVNGNWEATGTPGLEKISQMAGQDVEALSRYQLSARTLEVNQRGIQTGIDPADAAAEIAASPQLAQAHKAAVAFDRDMLHYWADAGGASPEGVAAMEALGQDYVHLGRVFNSTKKPGTRLGNVAQQLQPLRGSEREILDPWLSRVDRTARLVRAADRQRVVLNLVEMAESNPQGFAGVMKRVGEKKGAVVTEEARRIQEAAAKAGHEIDDDVATQLSEAMSDRALSKDNQISVWRNGHKETWELDPTIANALTGLGPQEVSWFSRLMGVGTGIFKGGVTLDPTFGAFNAFRDGFDASVQSRHGFRLGLDSFRGFHEAVRANWLGKPRKVYEDFVASGGGFSTLRGSGTKGSERVAEELAIGEASGRNVPLMDMVKHPLEALKRFALPFEEAARIGEFMRAKGAGMKDIAAFMAQQDVTVNFQEVGTAMRGLNMQVPFLNPAIQSLDRAAKTLGDPLVGLAKGREGAGNEAARVYATAVATITLPSILFWAASADDQEIKDLRKTNSGLIYWFLRAPSGEIVRMPKPFLYGQIFGTGAEAVLDRLFDEDPDAMGRWAKGVREQAVSTSLPMWAQIPSDIRANESSFFKTPIVPQGKEGLEPRLQYGPQTSTIFKKLGEATNTSPAKGEYVFNQMTGTLGRKGLGLADMLVEKASGEPAGPRELADNPVVGRFFARSNTTAKEPVRTFYDKMNELEKLNRTFTADQKDRPGQIAERYPPEVMRRLEMLPSYRAVARQLTDLRSQLDEVLASDMDAAAKKAYQKQVYDQIVELTRRLNEAAR